MSIAQTDGTSEAGSTDEGRPAVTTPVPTYVDLEAMRIWQNGPLALLGIAGVLVAVGVGSVIFLVSERGGTFRGLESALAAVGVLAGGLGCLLGYAYFDNVNRPVVGFDCTHGRCGKYVAAGDPWICGRCNERNVPVERQNPPAPQPSTPYKHWLTQGCGKCGRRPAAYRCHHCFDVIFLTAGLDGRHPALGAHTAYPVATVTPEVAEGTADPVDSPEAAAQRRLKEIMGRLSGATMIEDKLFEWMAAEMKRLEEDPAIDANTKERRRQRLTGLFNATLQTLKMDAVRGR